MRWTVPNMLTVARLLAAPMFAICFALLARPYADLVALSLFIFAAITDYLDGYLARRWDQITAFGRMMDPIADKAMVIIALAVLIGLSGLDVLVLVPAAAILFREVFVSGLREFLGADATRLKVTTLAKWKTTAQMVAIILMLIAGVFGIWVDALEARLAPDERDAILAGLAEYGLGLRMLNGLWDGIHALGLVLLWIAGALTLLTGADYYVKALPFLRDEKD